MALSMVHNGHRVHERFSIVRLMRHHTRQSSIRGTITADSTISNSKSHRGHRHIMAIHPNIYGLLDRFFVIPRCPSTMYPSVEVMFTWHLQRSHIGTIIQATSEHSKTSIWFGLNWLTLSGDRGSISQVYRPSVGAKCVFLPLHMHVRMPWRPPIARHTGRRKKYWVKPNRWTKKAK